MSFIHGRKTVVLLDQYDLTRFFTAANTKGEVDVLEATTFGANAKEYQGGFPSGQVNLEGLFEAANPLVVGADEYLASTIGASERPVISIAPAGLANVGDAAKMAWADSTSHNVDSSVEKLIVTSAQFLACEGLRRGLALAPLATYSTTGNGTSIDHGAASSNGLVAHLHVTSKTGTTPTIDWKVQHSVDNATWVDLITFTQATDITVERLTVTGTINRYLRAIRTIGGSGGPAFTSALLAARL